MYSTDWNLLSKLNKYLIKEICNFLGINSVFVDASTLDIKDLAATPLLLRICEILDANVYLSGSGSKGYLDPSQFKENGIDVVIQDFKPPIYSQLHGEFIPNLSVIDFLLNYGSEQNW